MLPVTTDLPPARENAREKQKTGLTAMTTTRGLNLKSLKKETESTSDEEPRAREIFVTSNVT
jgi:hypothetical protein